MRANPYTANASLLVLLAAAAASPQATPQQRPVGVSHWTAPLEQINDARIWRVVNRRATVLEEAGQMYVRLDNGDGVGVAWLLNSNFNEGTIEVDLRGRNLPGRSFVGIATRGKADDVRDVVYFRPFNFQESDPEHRSHAVQYESRPSFGWEQLRALHPGKYEAAIENAPQPEDWFHARIAVGGRTIRVFVNGVSAPCLTVTELSDRNGGLIGLNGTGADYRNLQILTKER